MRSTTSAVESVQFYVSLSKVLKKRYLGPGGSQVGSGGMEVEVEFPIPFGTFQNRNGKNSNLTLT